MSNNNRVIWADQVKAFAIWTMVLGHVGLQNQNIMDLIFIFHVPVFFIISGYFDKGIDISKAVAIAFIGILVKWLYSILQAASFPDYWNSTIAQSYQLSQTAWLILRWHQENIRASIDALGQLVRESDIGRYLLGMAPLQIPEPVLIRLVTSA